MGQRILTLATQAANDTLGDNERTAIKNEITKLMESIGQIGDRTKYSGNDLLSGAGTAYSMQISNDSGDKITLAATAFKAIDNVTNTNLAAVKTENIKDVGSIVWSVIQSKAALYVDDLMTQRSELGAYQNQMEYTLANITELSSNLSASKSRVIDTDYASETAALTRGQILQQAATAMLAQANQMPNVILTLLK
jgi:flagellin